MEQDVAVLAQDLLPACVTLVPIQTPLTFKSEYISVLTSGKRGIREITYHARCHKHLAIVRFNKSYYVIHRPTRLRVFICPSMKAAEEMVRIALSMDIDWSFTDRESQQAFLVSHVYIRLQPMLQEFGYLSLN